MKKQPTPCYLVCYTSWGSTCLRTEKPSISAAKKTAMEMKSDGFCFSYIVFDENKKKILARG